MAHQDKKSGSTSPAEDKREKNVREDSKKKDMNVEHEAKERLGTGLRSLYRNVLDEPLPADMMALLDQLDDDDDGSERSH